MQTRGVKVREYPDFLLGPLAWENYVGSYNLETIIARHVPLKNRVHDRRTKRFTDGFLSSRKDVIWREGKYFSNDFIFNIRKL